MRRRSRHFKTLRRTSFLYSLPGTPEVEPFYLAAGGAVELARKGAVLIDLSSVLPSTARKLEAGARAATLAVMIGGDAAMLEQVRPILNALGTNICHVGPAGAGNTIKAIHNTMSTVNTCAMMERFAVGLKAGFDLKTMADIVMASSGSGNSNALARVDRALIPRHFEPGFKVALMNKDLDTFHAMAKELHVPASFSNMAQH